MKSELQIEDVSVKSTSLEQVFINMARAQEDKEALEKAGRNQQTPVLTPVLTPVSTSVTQTNVTGASTSQPHVSPV